VGTTYYKRFRMEIDLRRTVVQEPVLPDGYEWAAWNWHPDFVDRHAWAKSLSFHDEVDSRVFPCLATFAGCRRLMSEIIAEDTFLPAASWLLVCTNSESGHVEDCGTIQGLVQPASLGAIQNVGVAAAHRGLGLGRALVLKSLRGFQLARMSRVYLDVTAQNHPAVRLYRAIGFRTTETSYKAVQSLPEPALV
jgi:hypothetical protein